MPAGDYQQKLDYTTISDFRPGIHSKALKSGVTAGTALPVPQGAAQVTNTFKCIALPTGGLAPLPKINQTFSIPLPDTDNNTAFGYFNVNGFFAFGPVGPGSVSPTNNRDDFFIVVEYVLAAAPNNRTVTYTRIDPITGTDPFPADQLAQVTSTQAQNSEQYQGSTWGVSRMSNTGPNFTNPGTPVVVTSWAPPGFAADMHVWCFPSPAAPAVTAVVELAPSANRGTTLGKTNAGDIIAHQGRILLLEYGTNQFGARGGDAIPTNEQISFSDPANSYNAFGGGSPYTIGTQQTVFEQEFPNGYGAWGSISAGELFLVKHQGGGILVSGDLNTPTVLRLGGVVPTGGLGCRSGVNRDGLFYYANRAGVYNWRGGDTSTLVSPQLENDFPLYTPGPSTLLDVTTQLVEWNDWVISTNGFLYDLVTQGWWRLDDPSTYVPHWFAKGFNSNFLYAVPLRATNAAGPGAKAGFIRQYDNRTGVNSFSWQGHPLPVSQDRTIEIRDSILLAQGNGTVAVTYTALDGTTQTETFTVTNQSQPQRLRPDTTAAGATSVNGYNIVPRIVSTGAGGGAAPIVHSIAIGHRDSVRAVST